MMVDMPIDGTFAPLVGQMAWNVRADEHGCVMLEFGGPHLEVREPKIAPAGSSPKVERLLARRSVHVLGDWHLWIESCSWSLRTRKGATSSAEETSNFWQDWMDDVSGQHLVSVESPLAGALTIRFDMGAVLDVSPDADGDLDSWSLYPWQGRVTSCNATGRLTVEAEKA
jgi:hypothetical protein